MPFPATRPIQDLFPGRTGFDLCRGPAYDLDRQGRQTAFRLMKVAGAYWARRFEQSDADANLRHGPFCEAGRPSTPILKQIEEAEKP